MCSILSEYFTAPAISCDTIITAVPLSFILQIQKTRRFYSTGNYKFISMLIFDILQKKLKLKWLASFDLGLSMLIGMAVAVLIG